jgi:hypothetical protein
VGRIAATIVADLCRRIGAGELRPGDRLPSGRDIAAERDVGVSAAYHALTRMRRDGLAEKVAGGPGMLVSEQAPAIAAAWLASGRGRVPAPVDPDFRTRLLDKAIELADADGLVLTSLRRIAMQLGTPPEVMRKFVRDRAHLHAMMTEAVFAEHPPPPMPAGGWRARLELLCRLQWQMYRRHPWLAETVSFAREPLGPHVAAHTEWAVRALADAELPPDTAPRLAATAANLVRGHGLTVEPEPARDAELFEFGLQRLLDGFARMTA